MAFAPYDNPEIAVLVLVEQGGQGHETALPVAKEILEEYFSQRPWSISGRAWQNFSIFLYYILIVFI